MEQSLKKTAGKREMVVWSPRFIPSSIYFHQLVPYTNCSTTSQNSIASWGTSDQTHKPGWGGGGISFLIAGTKTQDNSNLRNERLTLLKTRGSNQKGNMKIVRANSDGRLQWNCLLHTTRWIHVWTHRDCGCVHKTWAAPSQTGPNTEEGK